MNKLLLTCALIITNFHVYSQSIKLKVAAIYKSEGEVKSFIDQTKPDQTEDYYESRGKTIRAFYPGYKVLYAFKADKTCYSVGIHFDNEQTRKQMDKWLYDEGFVFNGQFLWKKEYPGTNAAGDKWTYTVYCTQAMNNQTIYTLYRNFDDFKRTY